MKLLHTFGILSVSIIGFISCDKISTPIIPGEKSSRPSSQWTNVDSSDATHTQYKMLLEVCGGQLCTNCPFGEDAAEAVLKSPIGAQVIFMQEEEGYESSTDSTNRPGGAPPNSFNVNYQCVADSTWFYQFGSPNQFPFGMANRDVVPPNKDPEFIGYPSYQNVCDTAVANHSTPTVTINIHDTLWSNTAPAILAAEFQLHFYQTLSGQYQYALIAVIVEDSITGWQLDNGVIKSNYIHRNILRGAFGNTNGGNPSGVSINNPNTGIAAGSTWSSDQLYDLTNGEYGKAKNWNKAHCHIVAFVVNEATYEVLQAEMIRME